MGNRIVFTLLLMMITLGGYSQTKLNIASQLITGFSDNGQTENATLVNSTPTALFNQEGVLLLGERITLDGSKSTYYNNANYGIYNAPDKRDRIVSYEWDFNYDGNNFTVDARGAVVNYKLISKGLINVALKVTDKYNHSSIVVKSFTVRAVNKISSVE